MDPMLMTRAGASWVPEASSSGTRNLVRWKTPFTLRAKTFSKAVSSKSARGVPQVAPALLTRMSSASTRDAISSARPRHPASVDRSAGTPKQVPLAESSVATSSHALALREEMKTVAPASTNPSAIILPIPRVPPVTKAVSPAMEKRSLALMAPLWPGCSRGGQRDRTAQHPGGPDPERLILHREGGTVVHAAGPVGTGASDEEVATGEAVEEFADVVAGGRRGHAEDSLGTEAVPGGCFNDVGHRPVVDHRRRALRDLEVDLDPVGVADGGTQRIESGEDLDPLLAGEGPHRARDLGRGGHHVDRRAGREHAGAADAVGSLVGQSVSHGAEAGHQRRGGPDDITLVGRHGAVPARAGERDAQRVRLGHGDALTQGHQPGGGLRRHMEAHQSGILHDVECP